MSVTGPSWPSCFFRICPSSKSTLSASFRVIRSKLMLMIKPNIGFFQQSRDETQRQIIQSDQVSNSSEISFMSTLSAIFRKIHSKLNEICWWQSQRLFQQSRGRNSKINDPILSVFKLIRDFIYVHLTCKFQADFIKTEQVMLLINRGFFSNQRDVNLRLTILSVQVSNSTEILSMSTLSASFRQILSKLNKLCCWETGAFSAIKGM